MANVRVKVEVKGIEEVSNLIEKHYDLLKKLEESLNQIYAARLELEVKLNQPILVEEDKEKKAERISEQLSEGKMSINQARKEYGLKPIEGGDIIAKIQPDSNNEPIEIKGPKREWFNLYESGIEIENENTVKNVIKLMLESGLNYLEMNRVLRDADGALRHKTFSTVLGQSNKPNYIPYGHSESDFTKL